LSERRLDILRKIESGELSAESGLGMISQLEGASQQAKDGPAGRKPGAGLGAEDAPTERAAGVEADAPRDMPDFRHWKVWTWIGFGLFTLLTAVSAFWMVQGWRAHPFGWGFWLSWIPFLIGIAGMMIMANSRWVHVRVLHTRGGRRERVAVSVPFLPGLVSWVFRTFPQWTPERAGRVDISEILDEMSRGISKDQPIYIQVDEKDGGQVEIYIG